MLVKKLQTIAKIFNKATRSCFKTDSELHYIPLEKLTTLNMGILAHFFLPTLAHVLDLAYKLPKNDISGIISGIALFSWCAEEVERYYLEYSEKLNKS